MPAVDLPPEVTAGKVGPPGLATRRPLCPLGRDGHAPAPSRAPPVASTPLARVLDRTRSVLFLTIRCALCEALFSLCLSCYRGHVYCDDRCRRDGYRRTRRAANARHRSSPEGRLDARDRQRARRLRRREVTDQGSAVPALPITVPPPEIPAEPMPAITPPAETSRDPTPIPARTARPPLTRCRRCGAVGTTWLQHHRPSRPRPRARARDG